MSKGRYRPRARLFVEHFIGRFLSKKQIVHHIDGNELNDEIENLFIFRHQSAHKRWHHFLRRHGLDGKILETNLANFKQLSRFPATA